MSAYNHIISYAKKHWADLVFVVLFVAALGSLFVGRDIFTNTISDMYYHLSVAQTIADSGQVPWWDDYNFQALGRPHVYPPLIPVTIALLSGFNSQVIINAPHVFQGLMILGGIGLYWWIVRKHMGSIWALMSMVVISHEHSFYASLGGFMPAALVAVSLPYIAWTITHKKPIVLAVILTLLMYAHPVFPWLLLMVLLVWGIWKYRLYGATILPAVAVAVLAFGPWIVTRYLPNMEYLWYRSSDQKQSVVDMMQSIGVASHYVFDWLWVVLLVIGFWVFYKKILPTLQPAIKEWFSVMLVLAMGLSPVLYYGGRYLWLLTPMLSIAAAATVKHFTWDRLRGRYPDYPSFARRIVIGVVVFLVAVATPLTGIGYLDKAYVSTTVMPSLWLQFVVRATSNEGVLGSLMTNEELTNLIAWARQVSKGRQPVNAIAENVRMTFLLYRVPIFGGSFQEVNSPNIEVATDTIINNSLVPTAGYLWQLETVKCQDWQESENIFWGMCQEK